MSLPTLNTVLGDLSRHGYTKKLRMQLGVFMLFIAVVATVVISQAYAQTNAPCFPFKSTVKTLESKYGETLKHRGLDASGAAILIFSNEKTGTFTVLAVLPRAPATDATDKIACSPASGTHWDSVATPKKVY